MVYHMVETFGATGVKLDSRSSTWARTPLHFAASAGHIESCRALINGSASIDAEDYNGYTPLCFALRSFQSAVHGISTHCTGQSLI